MAEAGPHYGKDLDPHKLKIPMPAEQEHGFNSGLRYWKSRCAEHQERIAQLEAELQAAQEERDDLQDSVSGARIELMEVKRELQAAQEREQTLRDAITNPHHWSPAWAEEVLAAQRPEERSALLQSAKGLNDPRNQDAQRTEELSE